MPAPLAYFLSWRTYGTWLHGDPRGSVDAEHNQVGRPRLLPDPRLAAAAAARQKSAPVELAEPARIIVSDTIHRHCELRHWRLLALNVRTNHVHIVVDCSRRPCSPERAMDQFKAWCTRRLREAGLAGAAAPVWVEHGSTRWINTEESLAKAIHYVLHEQ